MRAETLDLGKLTFDEWVKAVFAHPLNDLQWFWHCDFREPDEVKALEYITNLFEEPSCLDEYLDEQVNEGLNFLISSSCSNHMFAAYGEKPPLEEKVACIRSIYSLYSKCFAKRCSDHLSHIDEPGAKPINMVCYMFWDIVPMAGHPTNKTLKMLDQEILEVMEKTLALNSNACREGALHGLGHWKMYYPTEVEQIIDAFLRRENRLHPELQRYALSARSGCVQ